MDLKEVEALAIKERRGLWADRSPVAPRGVSQGRAKMNELKRSVDVAAPSESRQESAGLKRRLLRIRGKCLALSVRAEWCRASRQSATKRNAVTIREIASGPNFLLLASLSLFGTAIFWIIGDSIHWFLGIIFALVGVCVSFFVVLRVTFNATLFSESQLKAIEDASNGYLAILNADAAKLETEIARLKPLVEAEVAFEKELKRLKTERALIELERQKAEKAAEKAAAERQRQAEAERQVAAMESRIRAEYRRHGSPPTEKQLRFAAHLNMKLTGAETKEELILMIDRVVGRHTPEQEEDSKRRWRAKENAIARKEQQQKTRQEVEWSLSLNREMGETFITGFLVVRSSRCGKRHHGEFIKIGRALRQTASMPPFDDCNYHCRCEIIAVTKGETPREVLRSYSAG